MSQELAMLDGAVAPSEETRLPVTDEGFIRGDGVFEVVRVYGGTPFAFEEHLDRMETSAANLLLDHRPDRAKLTEEARTLLDERDPGGFDGLLRLILTRRGRRLLITEPMPQPPERMRLAYVTYAPTRVLDGIKSLSYAANMLCTRIAKKRGFDDALLVTPHGRVLESTTSSLFWVDRTDGALCTTPLSEHVLASITRAKLLELLDVKERTITSEELLEVPEAFIASTTREVHSVATIEDRDLGEVGEVTRKAAAAFSAHVDSVISG